MSKYIGQVESVRQPDIDPSDIGLDQAVADKLTQLGSNVLEYASGETSAYFRVSNSGASGDTRVEFVKNGSIIGDIGQFSSSDFVIRSSSSNGEIGFIAGGGNFSTATRALRVGTQGLRFQNGGDWLDRYEEGSWTPVLRNGNNMSSQNGTAMSNQDGGGRYTRIGNHVFFNCIARATANTGGGSYVAITGLPYATSSQPTSGGFTRDINIACPIGFSTNLDSRDIRAVMKPAGQINFITDTAGGGSWRGRVCLTLTVRLSIFA